MYVLKVASSGLPVIFISSSWISISIEITFIPLSFKEVKVALVGSAEASVYKSTFTPSAVLGTASVNTTIYLFASESVDVSNNLLAVFNPISIFVLDPITSEEIVFKAETISDFWFVRAGVIALASSSVPSLLTSVLVANSTTPILISELLDNSLSTNCEAESSTNCFLVVVLSPIVTCLVDILFDESIRSTTSPALLSSASWLFLTVRPISIVLSFVSHLINFFSNSPYLPKVILHTLFSTKVIVASALAVSAAKTDVDNKTNINIVKIKLRYFFIINTFLSI